MIFKKIVALKDLKLNTRVESVNLLKGEIRTVKFMNQGQFDSLLAFDNFRESYGKVPVVKKITTPATPKDIPVILPKVEDSTPEEPEINQSFETDLSETKKIKTDVSKKTPRRKKKDKTDLVKVCPNCDTTMIESGDTYKCPVCG